MNLYFRVQQADNGVYVELEVIALGRPPGGLMNASRYLNGFESYPHELTQYMIESLETIFPHRR